MSGTHLGRGNFFDPVCKQFSGRVGADVGMLPDFQAFLSNFWDMCAGHDRDALGTRQGYSLIFWHSWEVFEHSVQATSGTCPSLGCGRDASRLSGTFRQFLEHDVQAMSGMRLVRDRDAAWFSGSFRDTVCRPFQDAVISRTWCTGDVQDAVWT
ncbi:Hypothetical predicted protein [Olea europaea subsp. europaea]|uniref:Uncharacterized protein n=1 Tax=Olea europaea subsp. europaea TaxID=158383 RepID=A0A8S0S1J8_OLEEU|nr:Hypothetical predicted protein [Olea europaea subsp. europaea]